jgi:hypothetical protein
MYGSEECGPRHQKHVLQNSLHHKVIGKGRILKIVIHDHDSAFWVQSPSDHSRERTGETMTTDSLNEPSALDRAAAAKRAAELKLRRAAGPCMVGGGLVAIAAALAFGMAAMADAQQRGSGGDVQVVGALLLIVAGGLLTLGFVCLFK